MNLYVMDGAVKDSLPEDLSFVTVKGYDEIEQDVAALDASKTLWLDSGSANYALCLRIPEGMKTVDEATPIAMMKAVKNETEIKSSLNAHKKDAVAMVKFIKWIKDVAAKTPHQTELSAAEQLRKFRAEEDGFFDLSFETIAGYGPNGSVIHYAPTPETDAEILPEGFLLPVTYDTDQTVPSSTTHRHRKPMPKFCRKASCFWTPVVITQTVPRILPVPSPLDR